MPFLKAKFSRIWQLFRRNSVSGRSTNGSDIAKPSIEAVNLTPTGNPDRAVYLNNLSNHLITQYERGGKLEDLTQAIEYGQKAVDLTPTGNPNRASRLSNLSIYLSTRYKREGKLEDLTQAIEYSQEAVNLTPTGNPDQAGYLGNLSIYLGTRYKREGKLEDLTQAIKYSQEAVDLTPTGNPDRAGYLNNLSNCLSTQYKREGKLEDLTQAIKYSQEAVDLTPTGNPDRAGCLSNLRFMIATRYKREGKLEDLTQAIKYGQEAVNLTPTGNPDRAGCLSNLSIYLGTRYKREGKLEDLTQAIKYSQEAVDLTPTGNPNRAIYLNNLSNSLSTQYKRGGKLEDLTQAIKYGQEAVDLTPTGNPDRAGYLSNLSIYLGTRYEREGKLEDLTQAIKYGQEATNCLSSPPSIRIRGCLNAVNYLAQLQRWQEARALLGRGLEILPLLISNLSSKLDQENIMKSISGLAAIGCAVSLECSNNGFEAIRVLELSRGTINRLATNSTAETSMLYRFDPGLAKEFEDLRSLINAPSEGRENLSRTTLSKEAAAAKLHELVTHVRTNRGLEIFPSFAPKTELLETSFNQVTVLLNTTRFRTDALLLHGDKRVQVLPLDKSIFQHSKYYYHRLCGRFGYNEHKNWRRSNEDMRQFLIWLWDQIVDPILNAFSFKPSEILSRPNAPDSQVKTSCITPYRQADISKGLDAETLTTYLELMKQQPNVTSSVSSAKPSETRFRATIRNSVPSFPRIHWIGVGHMGSFPFHAAGYGSQDPSKNIMSCAISSYASTLTAQAHGKQKPAAFEASSSALLLVAMPKTPGGQPNLPGTEREAEIIQDTLQGLMAVKLHKLQPVDVILKDLPFYNSVHFACHGYADPQSPFQSGLLLCGNEPEKGFNKNTRNSMLTVETISSINTQHSLLAFLSACCTAENASSVLMDEGIHLAGGLQLAGYPHVIASLWEANDALSVAVAEKFYRIVFAESEIVGHDKIAYALHDAVLAARRICDDPLSWATTIHFGP
ncbi:hypothetical protein ABVK25_004637 [Lepraria finkii]|uniref:CHAT domain-containing protein n=1 Tax=Lepraria finkii TaxID=1340010 RepID=A0ABR4BBR6_9LECA